MLEATRHAKAALVLLLPLLGCAQPAAERSPPGDDAPPLEDRRPEVGRRTPGDDITELVREQNAPGKDPPLPTRRGIVTAGMRPSVVRLKDGFAARLPGAHHVPTPAFHRGRLYTGGYGAYEFHALDARTGKPSWSLHLSDDGPTDPACKEGVCVFNTYSCTLFSVDAETGRHLWSWYLGSPQLATPVVAGSVVYSSYPERSGPTEAQYVIGAFDLRTGQPLWRRWIDAEVNSTPVVHAGRLLLATRVGTLYELGAADGRVLAARRNQIASPPVVTAAGVLFGRGEAPSENDLLVTTRPLFPELEQAPIRREAIRPRPRPLVADHRLLTAEDGVVIATDRTTGRRLWRQRFAAGEIADISAPLVHAGPGILLATAAGNVLRLEPDTGEVTDTFRLGQGQIASQPIAVEGWIYAGTTAGVVVAVDTGDPRLTGWEMLGAGPDRRGTLSPEGT